MHKPEIKAMSRAVERGGQDNDDDGVGGRDMGPSERLGRAASIVKSLPTNQGCSRKT